MEKAILISLLGIVLQTQSLFSQKNEVGLKVIPGISYENPLFQDYFKSIVGGIYYQRPIWKDVLFLESGGYFSNQRKYQYISFDPFQESIIKLEENMIYGSVPLIIKVNAAKLFYFSFGMDMNFLLKENLVLPQQQINPRFILGGIIAIGKRIKVHDGVNIEIEARYNEFSSALINGEFTNRFNTRFHHVGLGIALILN